MATDHRPIKLIQEEDGFALWKVFYKGRSFMWPEAKRNGRKAVGPTYQQIDGHYNFLKWKEDKANELRRKEAVE